MSFSARPAAAQYLTRYTALTNGAVTFTGNTLGLDGAPTQNAPGTRGAIGTFITTDTTLRDSTPAPGWSAPTYNGTTSDWRRNRSTALLRLPLGAQVLHAELIWGGSFADRSNEGNVAAFVDDAVSFATPAGTFSVPSDPATRKSTGTLSGNRCGGNGECYYVRTANVTSLVRAGGAGIYSTGAVPATQSTGDELFPAAGWTLAVVYEDFDQPIRNLSLFLGLELSGGAVASVSGFCTPPAGPVSGRLAVTALEGDAAYTGDQMLFGPTSNLGTANRLEGPRNPATNFFSGQILDDEGQLDPFGSFGDRNHLPGNLLAAGGARQGWDITNVNASAGLRNNQTTAFARGTTSLETYRIMALALQIDVGAPRFPSTGSLSVDRATAVVGDVLTYTAIIDNSAGTTNANNIRFFDTLPAGLSFVANSVRVNGVTQAGANPAVGVPIGTLAIGATATVTFQARVDTVLPTAARVNQASWTFDFVSCAGQPAQQGSTTTNTVTTIVPVADLSITKTLVGGSPAVPGAPVLFRVEVRNAGPSVAVGAVVADPGTTPALVNQTWTCAGGPGGSTCPASGSGAINAPVNLVADGVVTFTINGTLPANTPAGLLTNTATVTAPAGVPDLNLANNTATFSGPIEPRADLRIDKSGPGSGQRGGVVTYTIVVTNDGPSNAQGVVVTDPTPAGLTLVSGLTGACAAAPGCAIAAGGSETLTVTFGIPPDYAGPDPIINTASVSSGTVDPDPADNTEDASTSLDAPVVDLAITKTDGVTEVTPGQTTTYTITITNAGPASAIGARVVDALSSPPFTNVQWQCAAAGTSACSVAGPQAGNIDTLIDVDPGPGNAVVITVTATILSTIPGSTSTPPGIVQNSAQVTVPAGASDSNQSNNTASDVDGTRSVADLSLVKAGPPTIVPGTTADYTITVSNAGPSTARDITFYETPVEGTNAATGVPRPDLIQSVTPPVDASCEPESVLDNITGAVIIIPICTIPVLEPGQSRVFTVRLAIPTDLPLTAITNDAGVITADVDEDPDLTDLASSVTSTIARQVDVTLAKVGPAAVVAGNPVSYFIEVSNNGPAAAFNVLASDILPPGLTFLGGSGICVESFRTGAACSIGTVAPGAHITTRIDLLVPADYAGPSPLTNSAVAVSSDPTAIELNGANNQQAVQTVVVPDHADVGVTLTGPASVPRGGTIEYTAVVTNFGPGPAFNVRSSDVLPAGATLIGGTVPPGPTTCTPPTPGSTNLVTCMTDVLGVGESLVFQFTLQVDPSVVAGSLLTNLATVSSSTPGHNPANNRAELVTRVTDDTEAGLSIEKTDSRDPVVVGETVTYTLTVRSQGPATATNVTVTDTLPPELSLVSATASQGTCAGATCPLGSIASSGVATVTIVATATVRGVFTNTATVSATEPDPVVANNTVSQVTTVALADEADVAIQKIGPTLEGPGDTSFYSIRVTNRGPAQATNVRVADTLPAGAIFLGNTGDCLTPFPCDFDRLAPGQTFVINTAFRVDPAQPTPAILVNNATANSESTADPDPTNNTSAVSTEIQPADSADLEVAKADSPDAVLGGAQLSYALSVLNRGPGTATNVTFTDVMPPGVMLISATPTQGTCTGTTTITCNVGTMPSGTVLEVAILARAPLTAGSYDNTLTASSGSPDPDPTNNTTTETTQVLPPQADLSVTKLPAGPAIPGLPITYEIAVLNSGPSAIAGATVIDSFPVALTGVTWTCVGDPGSACGAPSGATVLSTTVDLESGDRAIFVVTATIASGATGPLTNTVVAAVPGGAIDPVPANNTAVSTLPLAPSADVRVAKSGPVNATLGTSVTFTLTVTNAGPSDAVDVTLSDPTPAGLAFVAAGGDCTTAFPCALGTLPAGQSRTVTATFSVPLNYLTLGGADPIANAASAASSGTPDPATGNNTATAMSAIAAPVTDLSIVKTNGATTVVPGATTTYTITVSNGGPNAATAARVVDIFPTIISGVTWACAPGPGGGACATPAGSGDIDTTVDIPVNGSVVFTATGTVAPDALGLLVNTASVVAGPSQSDPSSNNNTDTDTLTPRADVGITKSGPAAAVVGGDVVYTIVATNHGPSNAANVTVVDPTPTGLRFVSNAGDCTTPFPCALGTLAPGASRTITAAFTLQTSIGVPLPIVNVTSISTTTDDPNAANDAAQFETSLNREADIEVTKAVSPSADVLVGDSIVFTVGVLNHGPNPATSVVVTDNLPAGFAFVSAEATQGDYDPATGAWTVGALAVDGAAELLLTVTVTSPGSITNLAVKTGANEPDAVTGNDSAAASINAAPAADLSIEKTVSQSEPLVGASVTFTVRVTNRGPSPATGVTIADTLPGGLTLVSTVPGQGSYDPSTGVWTVGALAAGAEATLALTATVDAPGAMTNNAATAGHDQIDPNPLNDRGAASINATANADLRVAKAISNTAPAVGSEVTYTIAVTNLGPSAATDAQIVDPLPAGVTFVSATPSQGTYDATTGLWAIGAMEVTAGETLSIVGRVTQLGAFDNTAARQTSAPVDPNPVNDGDTVSATSVSVADLTVIKSPTRPDVFAGAPATWIITATNAGPSPITAATVSDFFPAAVSGVQWTCTASTGGACGTATGTGPIATTLNLAAGSTATFVATGIVDPSATGMLTNVASVAAPAGVLDPDPSNNTSSAAILVAGVPEADLAIVKTGPDTFGAGGVVTYTLTITNQGPRTAQGVTVADPTPAGLTFESTSGDCTTPFPCSLGALDVGETRRIEATFRAASGAQQVVNVATVSATTVDPDPANNRATTSTPPAAGISVTKVRQGDLVPGQTVRYAITVRNNGPADVASVTLTDPTPPGLAFVASTGACTVAFPCALGRLPAGASLVVYAAFVVLPDTAIGATITNEVTATSPTPDPVPEDNVARDTGVVEAPTDGDGDGVPDVCEALAGLDPLRNDAGEDPDGDGLTNAEECDGGTHPRGVYKYYLSEGAQNSFFATRVFFGSLDPSESARVLIHRQGDDGGETLAWIELPPDGRTSIDAQSVLVGSGSFATFIESDLPLLAERTMDMVTGSSHTDRAVSALSPSWYFAEGATTGAFKLFYLLQNPHPEATVVTVTYLRAGGTPITRSYAMAAHSRLTLYLNEDPALVNQEISAVIQSAPLPIAASRSMYRDFDGVLAVAGASSAGVGRLQAEWLFGEGATGSFDLWLLLANFEAQAIDVDAEFIIGGGERLVRRLSLPPQSRTSLRVNDVDPALVNSGSVAIRVRSPGETPFLAERAMWWPGGVLGTIWYEGHHGTPAAQAAPAWRFAEDPGAVGETYLLIANFSDTPGEVRVTLTYDDGSASSRVVDITGPGRLTLRLQDLVPETAGRRFRIDVSSEGTPLDLVVERSTYRDSQGRAWGAGSNVVGAPVPP